MKFPIKNFFSKCDQIRSKLYLGIPSLYLGILLSLYPTSNYFWTQHQLTDPPVRSSTLPRRNMLASQGVLLDILFSYCPVLALFDLLLTHITHWCLFLNILTLVFFVMKGRCYPKYITLWLVYFYSKRTPLSGIYYSIWSLFLWRGTTAIRNV